MLAMLYMICIVRPAYPPPRSDPLPLYLRMFMAALGFLFVLERGEIAKYFVGRGISPNPVLIFDNSSVVETHSFLLPPSLLILPPPPASS